MAPEQVSHCSLPPKYYLSTYSVSPTGIASTDDQITDSLESIGKLFIAHNMSATNREGVCGRPATDLSTFYGTEITMKLLDQTQNRHLCIFDMNWRSSVSSSSSSEWGGDLYPERDVVLIFNHRNRAHLLCCQRLCHTGPGVCIVVGENLWAPTIDYSMEHSLIMWQPPHQPPRWQDSERGGIPMYLDLIISPSSAIHYSTNIRLLTGWWSSTEEFLGSQNKSRLIIDS